MAHRPSVSAPRSRVLLGLLGTGLAVAGVAVAAQPASSDPYAVGAPHAGYLPDDTRHTYCFAEGTERWTPAWRAIVDGRMRNLDAQTIYTAVRQPFCTARTDVRFMLDDSMSPYGDYHCEVFVDQASTVCEAGAIRLSSWQLVTDADRTKTACHEIGHSVGLQHFPGDVKEDPDGWWNDCMYSGPPIALGPQHLRYNTHHVDHINARRRVES